MLAVYRWFRLLMRKEHFLRTRYHRAHPHFLFYLALDCLVTASVLLGGFQIATAMSPKDPQLILLKNAGAKVLALDEIIEHVKAEKKIVYWLGAKTGYTYTPNYILGDVVTITYLPKAADLHRIDHPKLSVQTYDDMNSYVSHLFGYNPPSNTRITMQSAEGNMVEFDAISMQSETITFLDDPHVVVINYPTKQNPSTMLENADRLTLAW